jgi:hypothetical protein
MYTDIFVCVCMYLCVCVCIQRHTLAQVYVYMPAGIFVYVYVLRHCHIYEGTITCLCNRTQEYVVCEHVLAIIERICIGGCGYTCIGKIG